MVGGEANIPAAIGDFEVRAMRPDDVPAVRALHARAFGPGRFARTAYRVREGAPDFSAHCRTSWRGDALVGAVTMTAVSIGDAPDVHWLLGPLAVRPGDMNKGLGRELVRVAVHSAGDQSATATVVLVGDLDYYGRLGFDVATRGRIILPGPVDPARLLIWRGGDGTRAAPAGRMRAIAGAQPSVR